MRDVKCELYYEENGRIGVLLTNEFDLIASHDTRLNNFVDYEAAFNKEVIEFWRSHDWESYGEDERVSIWKEFLKKYHCDLFDTSDPMHFRYETVDPSRPFYIYHDGECGGEFIEQEDFHPLYHITSTKVPISTVAPTTDHCMAEPVDTEVSAKKD